MDVIDHFFDGPGLVSFPNFLGEVLAGELGGLGFTGSNQSNADVKAFVDSTMPQITDAVSINQATMPDARVRNHQN